MEALNPAQYYRHLPTMPLFFSLVLICATIYSLIRLLFILRGLRIARRDLSAQNVVGASQRMRLVDQRLASLRQFLLFVLYLFVFSFFLGLTSVLTIGESKNPCFQILEQFAVYLAYAIDVSLVLLILHCLQWIVSARAAAASRGLP